MRIAIYVGYQKERLNCNILDTTGIGGTELASIKIAEGLALYGHQVFLVGDVEPGLQNRVTWVSIAEASLKNLGPLDVIIAASYINFIKVFQEFTSAKKIFWAHNTDYYPWYMGEVIPNSERLLNKVDLTICLTEWHKSQWATKYNVKNIEVIGNGIDPANFRLEIPKVKNRFIWSSAAERGLIDLLKNWYRILHIKPDATLEIFSPIYALPELDTIAKETSLLEQTGIIVRGSQPQQELHKSMLRAEFWPYLTSYEETYCITALEMQIAGVLPITTNVAALSETINSGIILEDNETKWDLSLQILSILNNELKEKTIQSSKEWAKQQSWDSRVLQWHKLLKSICK